MLLQDKIAVVTGASRGIGRATAKALAREGAMVIVNYNGSKERADEVVSEIEKDGGKAKAIQCNVSDFEHDFCAASKCDCWWKFSFGYEFPLRPIRGGTI